MFKKIALPLFFTALFMLTIDANAQVGVDTQSPAYDIKAGGGLVYGTDIESLGLQANGYYRLPVNEQVFVGGDITYFFGDSESFPGGEESYSLLTININGQYHFYQDDGLGAYGLGGINYGMFRYSAEYDQASDFNTSGSESEVGLNLGAGVEYDLDFGMIYGELKFVVSGYDQLVLGAGVRIPLGN